MNQTPLKVFIVDDDPAQRLTMAHLLRGDGLELCEFADGRTCMSALDQHPDIVLLDIELPGADGIAICHALRRAGNDAAQVIFVSGHDNLDVRLMAYDAGGNDYIVKPLIPDEFQRKVAAARRAVEAGRKVTAEAKCAQMTAFTAMSMMGEMGVTQGFMRASFVCNTMDELALVVCDALAQYGLTGMVELRCNQEVRHRSTRGESPDQEVAILRHVRGLERIFQFRDRLAINYPFVTLLVSNLPMGDSERCGRLRDHLAVLAEGADARLAAMVGEFQRQRQADTIRSVVDALADTLADIDRTQAEQRIQVLGVAQTLLLRLTDTFVHLGLTEGQEATLVDLVQQAVAQIGDLVGNGASISQRLRDVAGRLKAEAAGDGDG